MTATVYHQQTNSVTLFSRINLIKTVIFYIETNKQTNMLVLTSLPKKKKKITKKYKKT